MKKVKLLICAMFLGLIANAQFVLTPNGFVDKNNSEKKFIVFEFEGKTQEQLYNSIIMTAGKTFVSPKDVISKIENKQITLNTIISKCVLADNKFQGGWDLNISLVFEFKDGKIKIEAPSVNSITNIISNKYSKMFISNPNASAFLFEWSIFDKNDKLKNKRAKETLEKTTNDIIQTFIVKIKDQEVW